MILNNFGSFWFMAEEMWRLQFNILLVNHWSSGCIVWLVCFCWISASPDGLVGLTHTVEVKCPLLGHGKKTEANSLFFISVLWQLRSAAALAEEFQVLYASALLLSATYNQQLSISIHVEQCIHHLLQCNSMLQMHMSDCASSIESKREIGCQWDYWVTEMSKF